jgi:outer membrane protein assembly factor BamB
VQRVLVIENREYGHLQGEDPMEDVRRRRASGPRSLALFVLAAAACGGGGASPDAAPGDAAADAVIDAAPAGDVVLEPAEVHFGLAEVGTAATQEVAVHNSGVAVVTLEAPSVFGTALGIEAITCGAALAPGERCTITVAFAPTELGAVDGVLSVETGLGRREAAITGSGAGRVTVNRSGVGAGRVTSEPPGIDCGATCSGLFAGPVVLTATSDPSSIFSGWTTGCGPAASCTVEVATTPATVTAAFDPVGGPYTVTIELAGEAAGVVRVDSDDGTHIVCEETCVITVGNGVAVTVAATTLSLFGSWSGACAGIDRRCTFTVAGAGTVTATFVREPAEVWTVVPSFQPQQLAFDAADHLLVAGRGRIDKLDPDGDLVWSRPLPSGAYLGLQVDSAGAAMLLDYQQLAKVDSDGNVVWSQPVGIGDLACCRGDSPEGFLDFLAVTPTDDVVVPGTRDGGRGISVYDTDGTLLWDRSVPEPVAALAVDGSGRILVAISLFFNASEVLAFAADGTPLGSIATLEGGGVNLAVDPDDHFVAAAWWTWVGGMVFVREGPMGWLVGGGAPEMYPAGVAIEPDGHVIAAHQAIGNGGLSVLRIAPDGTVVWTFTRRPDDLNYRGLAPLALAADHRGRFAVLGNGFLGRPAIRLYDPP